MILLCASLGQIVWFIVLMFGILPIGTVAIVIILIVKTIKMFRGDFNSTNTNFLVSENVPDVIER